ncbi:MAG: FAD-binding oxidoreductase [Pseudomonadales bacterium]|nr:FAD-binding oxidoreductase [Pseudomonadales bacterium]
MSNLPGNADIIVLGAGVAGLSAACFLSEAARVLVLERESQPAYHSSGRSAALYIRGYENPVVSALTGAGAEFLFTPPVDFAEAPLVHPRGSVTLAEPGSEPALARHLERWHAVCPGLTTIMPAEALDRVPILRRECIAAAAYDPDWYSVDVHALIMGYRKAVLRGGGAIVTHAAVRGIRHSDGLWHIDSSAGTARAPVVVNAAGAWAGAIGDLAGLGDVPLAPLRRTAVLVPAPVGYADWPVVHTMAEDLYFKPEGNGLMLCPEDEVPSEPCDAQPEEIDVARTVERFVELTTLAVPRLLGRWAGLRTFAPDRRPVTGFDPRAEGFFWLAGQGGFGVQTSPGLGRYVAGRILDAAPADPAIDVARFVHA